MTVASMPMKSAPTRSIPRALAASPRKMLPPPRTMPTSTPRSRSSRISCATPPMTFSSIPWPASPARISPLSLRRMRRNFGATPSLRAEAVAGEPPHHEILSGLGRGFLEQVADGLLVVANVGLLEQADLREELVELAAHDLVDDRSRLALVLELRDIDGALALHPLRRHVLATHVVGADGRHLHGEVPHQLLELGGAGDEIGLAVDLDQYADPSARMDVGVHPAF